MLAVVLWAIGVGPHAFVALILSKLSDEPGIAAESA
jgi:hypothetical protein